MSKTVFWFVVLAVLLVEAASAPSINEVGKDLKLLGSLGTEIKCVLVMRFMNFSFVSPYEVNPASHQRHESQH